MESEKSRCTKCGAFEVVFVGRSADPFNTKPPRLVCQKCGREYDLDSGIRVINRKTIHPFPNPTLDLDVDDSFTKKLKEKTKRRTD